RRGKRGTTVGPVGFGGGGGAGTDLRCGHASGAGALARAVAAGPGLDGKRRGDSPESGPAHGGRVGNRTPAAGTGRAGPYADGRFPPTVTDEHQAALKEAVPERPQAVGVPLANWTWKAVRQFLQQRAGVVLSRNSCLRYLHRLGFVWKRPKKRLTKADTAK